MYSLQDIELVNEKIDDIIEGIEEKKLDIFEPTKKEVMAAYEVVLEYIKEKKRKVYGGYSQNKAVVAKEPKDTFYKETAIPDIDYYSPEPLLDVKNLCDKLYAAGFKGVEGAQAAHSETYKVFVNGANVSDISYVPKNIYNKIPFHVIDEIHYVHPSFIYLDLYRIMTEPYFSSRIWKKVFPRLYKLQKHYPFNKASRALNNAYNIPKDKQEQVKNINKTILNEIKNKDTIFVIGQYAYNCFLEESGILKDKSIKNKYSLIPIPFMQLISTNYISDTVELIRVLQKTYSNKITYNEFYPLWQFTGYSTVVYYDQFPILNILHYNDRCTPIRHCNGIQIGSFDYIFYMNLVSLLRVKTNEVEDKIHYHNIMTSQLIEIRDYYFKKTKKNLLDDTLFQSFIADCIGKGYDPVRESRERMMKKREQGKMTVWRYHPESPRDIPDYKFANTSGNLINKTRNLKIKKYINNPELLEKMNTDEQEEQEQEDQEE
ncbi:hypothetical protein Indivirus_3_35 [Indivirus ILV1]|uniref:Putative poly(A) polymerase catalytic subunit n=1 Tax=Indivirus ILV1 TaxID=1977633 RepID=A0A1V0SDJ3_9VIRU|nr:hypothetical protein Indivirus_3_35 [Indivirus ILV1]